MTPSRQSGVGNADSSCARSAILARSRGFDARDSCMRSLRHFRVKPHMDMWPLNWDTQRPASDEAMLPVVRYR